MKKSCKNLEKKIENQKNQRKQKEKFPVVHVRQEDGKMKAVKIKGVQVIMNPMTDEEWAELESSLESNED